MSAASFMFWLAPNFHILKRAIKIKQKEYEYPIRPQTPPQSGKRKISASPIKAKNAKKDLNTMEEQVKGDGKK